MTISGTAPAKINLALHVTGRRGDGYHLLDSVVAFASVGDRLTVGPGDGLSVSGPFAAGVPRDDRNLVRRALAAAGIERAVHLEKNLPHPGGIGGGSSDAAAALRLSGAALEAGALLRLGADLPVCMFGRAARMRGVGERIEPLRMPRLHAVLVHPGLALPTPAVFAALDRADNAGLGALPRDAGAGDWLAWLSRQRNDLEAPAVRLAPALADLLDGIRAAGAVLARMSGSGATCFGLFPDAAAATAAAERLRAPGRWVRPCALG